MSKELTVRDERMLALRGHLNRQMDERMANVELLSDSTEKIAHTILTVRRRGGVGATSLALTLEYLLKRPLLQIEVGGAASPAFKTRKESEYLHIASTDPARVDKALDARLRFASEPAVIEFEPALYQRTLDIALTLRRLVSPSRISVFYIAGLHDPMPKYATNAYNRGLNDLYVCREAKQDIGRDPDNLLQLPWIDGGVCSRIMNDGLSLEDSLRLSESLWSASMTREAIARFGRQLLERSE